jgi:hypothetical protein
VAFSRTAVGIRQKKRKTVDGSMIENFTGDGADPVPVIFATSTARTADHGSVQDGRLLMSSDEIQVGLMLSPDSDNSSRTPLPVPPAQTTVPI